jgi:hypothetical protein
MSLTKKAEAKASWLTASSVAALYVDVGQITMAPVGVVAALIALVLAALVLPTPAPRPPPPHDLDCKMKRLALKCEELLLHMPQLLCNNHAVACWHQRCAVKAHGRHVHTRCPWPNHKQSSAVAIHP